MQQTKLHSLLEVATGIVIGFTINYWANMIILPMYGMELTHGDNLQIGIIYTFIAVARSYSIRRWFNAGIQTRIDQMSLFIIKYIGKNK